MTSTLLAFKPGDRVSCKWIPNGKYYSGLIARVEGSTVWVDFDDGDKQSNDQSLCRLLGNNTATNTTNPDNQAVTDELSIYKFEANSSSSDYWKSWTVSTNKGRGKLKTSDGKVWHLSLPGTKVKIETCIQGSKWWSKWKYYYNGNQLIAEADSKSRWKIDGVSNRLKARNGIGDNFDKWEVQGRKGYLYLTKSGSSWKSWNVNDKMPLESVHMKLAAIFAIIIGSDMKPE